MPLSVSPAGGYGSESLPVVLVVLRMCDLVSGFSSASSDGNRVLFKTFLRCSVRRLATRLVC